MCGLFGIINKKEQAFDKRAFYTLGVNNDLRGGDSCGVFIDGNIEYGTGEQKYFENFYLKSKLLEQTSKCRIAIGHCRKASIGGTRADLAQPCVIRDKQGNIEFVVTHNGTIKNYVELAKKYIPDENIAGLSDSQVMTLIFYHCGYDVLAEYIGSGAFVIADYREGEPRVFLFHGKSKEYKYSVTEKEERPLFIIETKNSLIYSSIPDYLKTLYYNHKLQYILHNLLVEFTDEGLKAVKEYDRSQCFMTAVETTAAGVYRGSPSVINLGRGNDDDDYDDDYYGRNNYGNNRNAGFQGQQENKSSNTVKSLWMGDNFTVFTKAGFRADGQYIVDAAGRIHETVEINTFCIYVFNGVVVKNKDCYDTLHRISTLWGMDHNCFYELMSSLVEFLSPFPFKDFNVTGTYLVYTVNDENDLSFERFSGSVQPLFKTQVYKYENGVQLQNDNEWEAAANSFELLRGVADYEIPREIITSYLNDFV